MDPATATLLMGTMQAGGGFLGANMQERASRGMASDMMNFQKEMSSTAHQREKADLDAAGYNPILGAMGAGSSSPQGAMGTATNQLEGVSEGISTGLALRAQNKELELKDKQIEGQTASIANVKADTMNKGAQTAGILNQNKLTAQQSVAADLSNQLSRETMKDQIAKLKAEGKYAEAQQLGRLLQAGTSSAKDAAAIAGELVGGVVGKTIKRGAGALGEAIKSAPGKAKSTIERGQFGG